MSLDPYQLQEGLNRVFPSDVVYYFDVNCCKAIIAAHDPQRTYRFHWKEFPALSASLVQWARVFAEFDRNQDGYLLPGQCIAALRSIGFDSILSLLSNGIQGWYRFVVRYCCP